MLTEQNISHRFSRAQQRKPRSGDVAVSGCGLDATVLGYDECGVRAFEVATPVAILTAPQSAIGG
jgi:hypothetical protein